MDKSRLNNAVYFYIQPDQLVLENSLIARSAGYPKNSAPKYFIDQIDYELKHAINNAEIKAGYIIFSENEFNLSEKGFFIENEFFDTGKIIATQLKNSTGIIIFSATVGTYFDIEVKNAFESGDSVKGLIIDTIGSELVESVGANMEQFLISELKKENFNLTNRLSPGYCEWNVAEQQKLFSFLPPNFCGISLNEAFMMNPLKSISGIIGYGKKVIKKDYACKICGLDYCYKRNLLYS